ncbi:MAG: ABC transporter permease, partial [Acidobacteria bacterium]|nr:ABC transporter permease [Acidobacteriota bacterium]
AARGGEDLDVAGGRFMVDLDFGIEAFDGSARWLEITVEGETLAPRQPIASAPYAVRALTSAETDWTSITNVPAGFADGDQSWAVVAESTLAGIPGAGAPSWEIALADPARAPAVADAIRDRLGPDYLVADWTQLNRELFAALRLQKLALFLLIGLVLVVATFNVASTLVVLVRERRRDLGVLAALGLEPGRLERTALFYGLFLGAAGTAAGLALAAVVAWVIDRFQLLSFGPEVAAIYFLSSVPLRLSVADAATIALFALVVTVLSCWLPARRARRLVPSAAVQYE